MKSSKFVFNYAHLFYHKCHWIKNATVNPVNKKDDKCFQFAVTMTLNHEEIGNHYERVQKIKTFYK